MVSSKVSGFYSFSLEASKLILFQSNYEEVPRFHFYQELRSCFGEKHCHNNEESNLANGYDEKL